MIKVKFISRTIGTNEELNDEATIEPTGNIEEQIKAIIVTFNEEEKRRYGDNGRPREFVRLLNEKSQLTHEWDKIGFYHGAIQPYRCKNCGLQIEALIGNIPRRYSGDCHPERVCKHCNKEFKTKENYERHYTRFHE